MSSRLPPPRGSSGYMAKLYRADLRPVILAGAFFAVLWSLTSGLSSFRNVPYLNKDNEVKLGLLYVILGSVFMVIAIIEAFGIFAAASRRLAAVRTFAYLSILVTILTAAAYIVQTAANYSFKNDIINICSNVTAGDRIFYTSFFGPTEGGVVTRAQAQVWCSQQFDRNAFANIVAIVVTTAVSAAFVPMVFVFVRQLLDPSSATNHSRVPRPTTLYPGYEQPYNYPPPNFPPPNTFNAPNPSSATPPYYASNDYASNDYGPNNYGSNNYGSNNDGLKNQSEISLPKYALKDEPRNNFRDQKDDQKDGDPFSDGPEGRNVGY